MVSIYGFSVLQRKIWFRFYFFNKGKSGMVPRLLLRVSGGLTP